jgi:sugar lactone lactonase YvrE
MPRIPTRLPARPRRLRRGAALAASLLAAGTAGSTPLEPGDIVVADASANKLFVIDPQATPPTVPTQIASGSPLGSPVAVAIRNDGFAFVTNPGSQLITRVDPAATPPAPLQSVVSALVNARGMAIDPTSGDLFVGSTFTDQILRIDSVTGTGAPVSTAVQIQFPSGILREPTGDLVVADASTFSDPVYGSQKVVRIAQNGAQTVLTSSGFLMTVRDVEIDPDAACLSPETPAASCTSFLVVDSGARKVFRVDASGPFDPTHPTDNQSVWAECAQFLSPRGIAREASGDILVSDFSARQIFRIDRVTRVCTALATGTALVGPWDVAVAPLTPFDPTPLLVADAATDKIYRVDPQDGSGQDIWPGLVFSDPVAAIRDVSGDYFVLEPASIQRVTPGGVKTLIATITPNPGDQPVALAWIAVDANGEILVTDGSNDRLLRVIPGTGQQIVVADDDAPTPALLGDPAGFALDRNGTLLVANRGDAADTPPIATGLVRVNPVSGDSSPLVNDGQFGQIVDVALDSNGDYLIADRGNDKVWRFRASTPGDLVLFPVSSDDKIESLRGIAVDLNRAVLVGNQDVAEILRLDPLSGFQVDVAPALSFAGIQSIALDRIPTPPQLDSDGDGIADTSDNCSLLATPDQTDTNQDGYGNRCDADVTGDGVVSPSDFTLFKAAYLTGPENPGYDEDLDFDSDDSIGPSDFVAFKGMFLHPVGPSGLTCAGSIPCPPP